MPSAVAIPPNSSSPVGDQWAEHVSASVRSTRLGQPARQFRPIFRQMPKGTQDPRWGRGNTSRPMDGRTTVVVPDGGSGRQRPQSRRILAELSCPISSRHRLRVAWFDSEPTLEQRLSVRDSKRELLRVAPRTPMRDTMEAGLAVRAFSPPHAMVTIVEEQFHPTSVPASRPLQLARSSAAGSTRSKLASGPPPRCAHRVAHSTGNAFLPTFERFLVGQRSYSTAETAGELKLLAVATGGWFTLRKVSGPRLPALPRFSALLKICTVQRSHLVELDQPFHAASRHRWPFRNRQDARSAPLRRHCSPVEQRRQF